MTDSSAPIRIAMWSGPRNISTAMMRSWGNRSDTVVIDEPFYAFYLKVTGKKHPGAAEVIAHGEIDWRKVVERLLAPIPNGKRIWFQKQMTHHLLPEVDRQWLGAVTNCFLIRDPTEVISSYIKKNNVDLMLEDFGFVQQAKIFDYVVGMSRRDVRGQRSALSLPIVIDARDVLENPRKILGLLCEAVGVDFDEAMLSWPPGLRETDGVWAKHWYGEVAGSTSFQPYRQKHVVVPERFREIHEQCRECYDRLYRNRLY